MLRRKERTAFAERIKMVNRQVRGLAADLGYTDSCSWWGWQETPDGYRIVDFYEADLTARKLNACIATYNQVREMINQKESK